MKDFKKYPLFWLTVVFVVSFTLGWVLGHRDLEVQVKNFVPKINITTREPPKDLNVDFSLFWKVWEELPKKYVDKSKIDTQQLLYGAISGMVRALGDPYTAFLNPEQNQAVKEELAGSYEGVGIQLGFNKDKQLIIVTPLRGTPAEEAGLRPKDLILKINDKEAFDITLPEAVSQIRGKAGTKVKITFRHEGETNDQIVELTRSRITIKSVEVEYKNDIAVIKLSRFSQNTQGEWDKAVSEILSKNVKAIVLDVRNNPGGFLSGAVYIGSEFLSGEIVRQELSSGDEQSYRAQRQGKLLDKKLVVLVNGGSASASEILAGAIKVKGRGKIVGEQTFGKGTIQEVSEFEGGSALHVTSAKWLLPGGKSINGEGLKPDVEVKMTAEDREKGRDPQLEKAVELAS